MFRIDPKRLDLAAEFRANPIGIHSPDWIHMQLRSWNFERFASTDESALRSTTKDPGLEKLARLRERVRQRFARKDADGAPLPRNSLSR